MASETTTDAISQQHFQFIYIGQSEFAALARRTVIRALVCLGLLGHFQGLVQSVLGSFCRPVGHTTAAVQPGKKDIGRGTLKKQTQNLRKQPNNAGCIHQ